MRPYSDIEKQIITTLVGKETDVVTLIDFIAPAWSKGKFEISSYQQKLVVYLEKGQMDAVMAYILEIIQLIDYLERRGYISSWVAFPMSDNTATCGDNPGGLDPQFLPDLSVASKLLNLANRKYKLHASLTDLVARNFKSQRRREIKQIKAIISIGFVLLIAVSGLNMYMNYRVIEDGIKVEMKQIRKENAALQRNQELSKVILDTLSMQSEQLLQMAQRTHGNTENLQQMQSLLERQTNQLNYMRRGQKALAVIVDENREILKKTDSLLNKTPNN
ncbi:hypothetical protein [Marinoscillum sp.]|uniref:hypothetical protein n=1 Tax=Marinoscillum sp. TaxID=2024838 RepID=UPI003BADB6C3